MVAVLASHVTAGLGKNLIPALRILAIFRNQLSAISLGYTGKDVFGNSPEKC